MQAALEERIRGLGLSENIRLLGRRSDVNVLMRLSSLFLMTSQKEGMPNVVMEAQLMGVPVVATRAGGTSAIVLEGRTGYLADVGDGDGLTAACLKILREPARRVQMGEAGRRHVLYAFPKRKLGERYLDVARGLDPEVPEEVVPADPDARDVA